jgi:hypothetical protein
MIWWFFVLFCRIRGETTQKNHPQTLTAQANSMMPIVASSAPVSVHKVLTQSLFIHGQPRIRCVGLPQVCSGWRSVSFSQVGQAYVA